MEELIGSSSPRKIDSLSLQYLYMVYAWVLLCIVFATIGAISFLWYNFETEKAAIQFLYSLIWVMYFLKKGKVWALCVTLLFSFLLIGALSGPLINSFYKVEQRHIIRFWGAGILLFLYQILSLKGQNYRPLFNLNHLLSPILIIYVFCSNVLFGRLHIYGHPIPTNPISVLSYLFSIPILWFAFERLLKNHTFTSFPWVFGHIHFLTLVSVIFCYPYTKTLGIYVFVVMVQFNLDLYTSYAMTLIYYQSALLTAITFFTEFPTRVICTLHVGATIVYRHIYSLWQDYQYGILARHRTLRWTLVWTRHWTMVICKGLFKFLLSILEACSVTGQKLGGYAPRFLEFLRIVGGIFVSCTTTSTKIMDYTPHIVELLKHVGRIFEEFWNFIGRMSAAYEKAYVRKKA